LIVSFLLKLILLFLCLYALHSEGSLLEFD
jgi:hypothetical protein